jgi:hypothetical protein
MKLTKVDIQFIDHFLINKGIKYMDVRVELIDHLSSDYEENSNYGLLEDYLKSKITFVTEFEKNRHTKLHWSYQKQVWLEFFKNFYTLMGLVKTASITLILVFGLYLLEIKSVAIVSLITAAVINLTAMFTHFKQRKSIKKLQSSVLIFGVLSLPALPLYTYSQINTFIESSNLVFILFWLVVILLNVSAAELVYQLKNKIIENYNKLTLA